MLGQQHEEGGAHEPGPLHREQPRLGNRIHDPAHLRGEEEGHEPHDDRCPDPQRDPGDALAARPKRVRAPKGQDDAEPPHERRGGQASPAGPARSPLPAPGRDHSQDGGAADHGKIHRHNQRCPPRGDRRLHLSPLLSSLMQLTIAESVLSSN